MDQTLLYIWISWGIWNRIRKYFRVLVWGLGVINWRKNRGSKISWHCLHQYILICNILYFKCQIVPLISWPKHKNLNLDRNKIWRYNHANFSSEKVSLITITAQSCVSLHCINFLLLQRQQSCFFFKKKVHFCVHCYANRRNRRKIFRLL
jgi:hypothetical protein